MGSTGEGQPTLAVTVHANKCGAFSDFELKTQAVNAGDLVG
jgi:hypothetical protein